jgi:hypothetical protein
MPTHSEFHTTAIELDNDIIVRFRVEAAKRERTVTSLIRELLDVIATDRLTTAILDDAPQRAE